MSLTILKVHRDCVMDRGKVQKINNREKLRSVHYTCYTNQQDYASRGFVFTTDFAGI